MINSSCGGHDLHRAVFSLCLKSASPSSPSRTAAWVTALEAACSDLAGLGVVRDASAVFFCGNFGILLLHPTWTTARNDYIQEALDLPTKKV